MNVETRLSVPSEDGFVLLSDDDISPFSKMAVYLGVQDKNEIESYIHRVIHLARSFGYLFLQKGTEKIFGSKSKGRGF